MHARVTHFKMKAGKRDAAIAKMEELKDRILGMPGMHNFINVMDDDGDGYVISIVESEASSEANADTVKALWGEFADYLEAMPTPKGFDVVASWAR